MISFLTRLATVISVGCLLLVPLGGVGLAQAEPMDFFKPEGAVYDPAITKPEDFIGYGLGEKPVRHDVMVGYLRSLARQSARLQVSTIGRSHEGRPILSFVVSAPENMARIDEIKANHKDRLAGKGDAAADPVIVWLNYGVHGAESSGMDAAIPTLYHLAAATGDDIDALLRDTVIVVIAIFNPDGHSRRVNHVYTFDSTVPVTDRNHEAHNLWIEARTNHYWFDLNRDWLLLTQPESRSWIKVWHDWKPNVSGDFHEQGSDATYYFHPGEPKRKNPLIPDRERELLASLGEEHANWLDKQGELYTAEEGFDNFYIGKGSTYPSINGSVGILFEAAAARGGEVETVNGVRTYAQNIRLHFNTSLTTISGAHKMRDDLKTYQRDFFVRAERAGRNDDRKAFVFTARGDAARTHAFVRLLKSHDVDVFALNQDITLGEQSFAKATSFIVPVAQDQYTMIRGIFDQVTAFEESVFYDVSGWTLPLAYDLDYTVLDAFRFSQNLLGAAANDQPAAVPAPTKGAYGYVFSWTDYYAPRALGRFLRAGAKPRVFLRPKTLTVDGETVEFDRGSIFIPAVTRESLTETIDGNSLLKTAIEVAARDGVRVYPLQSGNVGAGQGDLGARSSVHTVRAPKVLLTFDDGRTRYAAGQLWHLLDHKMHIPVTLRRQRDLARIDLSVYTHILMPGGARKPGAELTRSLRRWVNGGGTLVATKDAAAWAQKTFLTKADTAGKKDNKTDEGPAPSGGATRANYADKTLNDAEHLIGGALFESDLDISHPLGFGFADRRVATMKAGSTVLRGSNDPYAVVGAYGETPLLSGYASDRRLGELKQTPSLIGQRMGRGGLILFADDPAFRATFLGADKLMMNAIFFADAFQPARLP
ncbi:MAG: M14 family zinc carboxypeptidase [Pseudomonadota bacterium]